MKKLKSQGGDGGVIGLDSQGVVIHFNTVAMPRGYINSKGETVVLIDLDQSLHTYFLNNFEDRRFCQTVVESSQWLKMPRVFH